MTVSYRALIIFPTVTASLSFVIWWATHIQFIKLELYQLNKLLHSFTEDVIAESRFVEMALLHTVCVTEKQQITFYSSLKVLFSDNNLNQQKLVGKNTSSQSQFLLSPHGISAVTP